MNPPPILHWQALSREPLLHACHGNIQAQDSIVLTGASGSGKSLLWRALAGLDPCQYTQLILHGKPRAHYTPTQWRHHIAYIAQQANCSEHDAESVLQQPFTYRQHRYRHYQRPRIEQWLASLNKTHILHQPISELSGGEKHIIHILRTLQLDPTILLLDEPTAALDEITTQKLEQLIQHWQNSHPTRATLWISHDTNQAERIATRHWTMHNHQLKTDTPS